MPASSILKSPMLTMAMLFLASSSVEAGPFEFSDRLRIWRNFAQFPNIPPREPELVYDESVFENSEVLSSYVDRVIPDPLRLFVPFSINVLLLETDICSCDDPDERALISDLVRLTTTRVEEGPFTRLLTESQSPQSLVQRRYPTLT